MLSVTEATVQISVAKLCEIIRGAMFFFLVPLFTFKNCIISINITHINSLKSVTGLNLNVCQSLFY